MRTITLAAVIWSILVGTVVVARAEDAIVYAPAACRLTTAQALELHLGTCEGDLACTAALVAAVCHGEAVSK